PDEHVEALLVRHPGRRRRALGPRSVRVFQGVGDDAVDLHAVRHARLLETVGPGALHTVGAHTVGRGERVRPAREAADDATTCVAATRSPSLITRSCTGTMGRLRRSDSQWAPSSNDTHTPCSVPANKRPRRTGSSRTTRTKSVAGIPFTSFVQVFP